MLKNALFFDKSWKNCRSVGLGLGDLQREFEDGAPKPRWPPAAGFSPPDPQIVAPTQLRLRVTFEYYSAFSVLLKLRPIISYLSDG